MMSSLNVLNIPMLLLTPVCCPPGVHDDEDPEYSILKARMINKMKDEGLTVDDGFGLADITKVAERTISAVSSRHLACR